MSEKTSTEFEIKVSGGKTPECDRVFVKVEASKLSLEDEFMKHRPKPKTWEEILFMEELEDVIKRGPKDFWRPVCDPSFDDEGRICYKPGKKPAVGKNYNWWEKNAKDFCPERGSRLGTHFEYIAFLAVIIKKMVENGWEAANAWHAVCNDSRKLGHYWNSENFKKGFEPTGSREICGFFDLANTGKILTDGSEANNGFWIFSGSYGTPGNHFPLAWMEFHTWREGECERQCGWLVFDSCPEC